MKKIIKLHTNGLFLILLIGALNATAAQPPRIPVYYEGEILTMTVVNDNVVGVEEKEVAIPLYSFGRPGNRPQLDVVAEAPGEAGYNPWWETIRVVVLNGRDLTTDPFTSEEEILEAAAANEVQLIETEFYFLCQILPGLKPS